MTMDTKTTEWEERLRYQIRARMAWQNIKPVNGEVFHDEREDKFVELVRSHVHQSRTELMRKCLGVVKKVRCNNTNCQGECNFCEDYSFALLKMAEEEGIHIDTASEK